MPRLKRSQRNPKDLFVQPKKAKKLTKSFLRKASKIFSAPRQINDAKIVTSASQFRRLCSNLLKDGFKEVVNPEAYILNVSEFGGGDFRLFQKNGKMVPVISISLKKPTNSQSLSYVDRQKNQILGVMAHEVGHAINSLIKVWRKMPTKFSRTDEAIAELISYDILLQIGKLSNFDIQMSKVYFLFRDRQIMDLLDFVVKKKFDRKRRREIINLLINREFESPKQALEFIQSMS
ncbi:MAG: hypothetical protein Q7S21_00675 [archaeon]|nr:hypothetical protein [archaeon]